jgi:hypothetical protein
MSLKFWKNWQKNTKFGHLTKKKKAFCTSRADSLTVRNPILSAGWSSYRLRRGKIIDVDQGFLISPPV